MAQFFAAAVIFGDLPGLVLRFHYGADSRLVASFGLNE